LIVRLVGPSPVHTQSIVPGCESALHVSLGYPLPCHVKVEFVLATWVVPSVVPAPGPASASATMLATASQPALRNVVARVRRRMFVSIVLLSPKMLTRRTSAADKTGCDWAIWQGLRLLVGPFAR
jgi:hypothetical protein